MFCDNCGDLVTAAKVILVAYPSGKTKKATDDLMKLLQQYNYEVLQVQICPECWDEDFEGSRKKQVAAMLCVLKDDE